MEQPWPRTRKSRRLASLSFFFLTHARIHLVHWAQKLQEYFIKAALNPNPHPHAMLTVGFWLREGSLGAFGKQVMMGYSHRQIWDRCIQLFPGHKYALMAAQLMAQEYLQEGNVQVSKRLGDVGVLY